MKGLKKLLTGILAATMIFGASLTAFAAEDPEQIGNSLTVTEAVKGETYNIYKLLDLKVSKAATTDSESGYSYTINDAWKDFWTKGAGKDYVTLTVGANETYVTWKNDMKTAEKMETFGKAAAVWAKGKGLEVKTAITVGDDLKAEFKGLEDGYYMVTSTLGSAVAIASTPTNPQQIIKEKNSGTTTEKVVLEGNAYGASNDAQIGDTVTFKSTVNISKNQINVKYHDVMTDGLTWDGVEATKVFLNEGNEGLTNEVTDGFEIKAGARTDADPDAFVVEFADDFVAGLTYGADDGIAHVYIQYTATLNDNALVGRDQETNTPIVTFGRSGRSEGQPTDTTTHYFKILKFDGKDGDKNPLAGAKFQLFEAGEQTPLTLAYKTVEEGQEVTVYRVVDMSDNGATLPEGYALVGGNNEIVTVASEKITVEGVDSKNYELLETEAPLGFNKIDSRIAITILTDNTLIKEVENFSGSVLPSTGGIGTTIFYILGGILIVAGVAYFIVRRKASAE